jgi:hypothetical protein
MFGISGMIRAMPQIRGRGSGSGMLATGGRAMIGRGAIWALLAVLPGCTSVAPENSLLLVHGPAEVAGTSPAWCYSTLADADCYIERDERSTDRLIGAFIPYDAGD